MVCAPLEKDQITSPWRRSRLSFSQPCAAARALPETPRCTAHAPIAAPQRRPPATARTTPSKRAPRDAQPRIFIQHADATTAHLELTLSLATCSRYVMPMLIAVYFVRRCSATPGPAPPRSGTRTTRATRFSTNQPRSSTPSRGSLALAAEAHRGCNPDEFSREPGKPPQILARSEAIACRRDRRVHTATYRGHA